MTNADKLQMALKTLKELEPHMPKPPADAYYILQGVVTTIASVHADLLAADVAKRKADIKAEKLPPVKRG